MFLIVGLNQARCLMDKSIILSLLLKIKNPMPTNAYRQAGGRQEKSKIKNSDSQLNLSPKELTRLAAGFTRFWFYQPLYLINQLIKMWLLTVLFWLKTGKK